MQLPETGKAIKDTTQKPTNPVRYRVDETVFVNGRLVHPGDGEPNYVTASAGMASKALVPVDANGKPFPAEPAAKSAPASPAGK